MVSDTRLWDHSRDLYVGARDGDHVHTVSFFAGSIPVRPFELLGDCTPSNWLGGLSIRALEVQDSS